MSSYENLKEPLLPKESIDEFEAMSTDHLNASTPAEIEAISTDHLNASTPTDLSSEMTCTAFLLKCPTNLWFRGRIYKKNGIVDPLTAVLTAPYIGANLIMGFRDFYSYKFSHVFKGVQRTFCITFREKFFKQKNFFVSRREKEIDTYHIRLSLTEESTRYPDEMSCREESMKLDSEGELENLHNARANDAGYVEAPLNSTYINVMDKNRFKKAWINGFSSITSGQNFHYSGDSIVKEMQKVNEDAVPEYIKKVMLKIFHDIDRLGGLLLCHCEGVNTGFYGDGRSQNRDAPPSGGATRKHTRLTHRRKRLLGRKGKKSYRKKKYSKTKKSRRFRRSVRSRR